MEQLSRKQQAAIASLISHRTIEEAAQIACVGKTALFRWFQDEAFQNAYREARSEVVRQAIAQAQNACSEAVDVLRGIMNDDKSPASTRVSAAKSVLETSIKAVELEDIINRIKKLEDKIQNRREL
jgi:hypothetical protein